MLHWFNYKHGRRRRIVLLLLGSVVVCTTSSSSSVDFLDYCTSKLGIYSAAYIRDFEYNLTNNNNAVLLRPTNYEDDLFFVQETTTTTTDDHHSSTNQTTTMIRGLAARHDLKVDDIILKIPLPAILTVPNFIYSDPILGQYISSTTTTISSDDDLYYLAVGLLHHRRLGPSSPIAPYIDMLPPNMHDSMPFLWYNPSQLKLYNENVRQIVRSIRMEIKSTYGRIVQPLINDHPDVFNATVFSFENYQWAFGIVNSRHWQLPVSSYPNHPSILSVFPPTPSNDSTSTTTPQPHSFLAPIADLLNFGPPCTKVRYTEDSYFEIVATCDIAKDSEITFWYSNECADVIFSVYGFTSSLVVPCKTYDEWRTTVDTLEHELSDLYSELALLEELLEHYEQTATTDDGCDCCQQPASSSNLRKERTRRRSDRKHDTGLRRWSRKTEF